MEYQYTNRLIHETSPYLLQHAHNPVEWYPWGDEAFRKAVEEDKPILLSIGYSACHWCHVMEEESFENEEIAEETLGYLLRELCHPDGGFHSFQDADSEGEICTVRYIDSYNRPPSSIASLKKFLKTIFIKFNKEGLS